MFGRGAILHQHDVQVHHNGLEKVCGYARAVDLERANVFQAVVGFESNERSNSLIGYVGEASPRAAFYVEILVNHILRQHGARDLRSRFETVLRQYQTVR